MTPLERPVFVLREVFGFFDALAEGDVDGLQEMLAADVQLAGDGGRALQLARSIIGAEKVARMLASVFPGWSGST